MHLVVYDATGHGKAPVQPLLTASWRWGSALYRHHPQTRVDGRYGATSWEDALAWLCSVEPTERISSIQYWGHGLFGRVLIGDDVLDASAFVAGHARNEDLVTLRGRLRGENSLLWFRTCATFGGHRGHDFARTVSRFLGCRVAGHTHVIGPLQSGLHSLRAGDEPRWSVDEGIPAEFVGNDDAAKTALPSSLLASHTVTCLHSAVPDGW